jgi:hypothetical protein
MTDKKDEIAELRAEVEKLKAAQPKPKPSWEDQARADEEHRSRIHAMRERSANTWMPPSAVQALVEGEPKGFMREVALRDGRAPNTPAMIPRTNQQPSDVRPRTGSSEPVPISVPGGTRTHELIERMANAALPHGPEWGKKPKG